MARVSERIGSALSQHGYEQVRTVGEGSFGKAILVRPTSPSADADEKDKHAIVKMVDVSRASKKEKQDALQESQVLSSLKHPNIVSYRNNFLAEGWLCIVMDYCEGGDLSSRVKKTRAQGKSFSEEQVLWWFTQGILALKYIHDMHILHRDLKSGNLFLSKSGNIKIGDFGIAKVLECTAACAQTQVGTPYYLCPEICRGRPYSWGSDIWAMGCILHELCALKVPFDGHDLKTLIQSITKAPTPKLPSKYSKSLQDVLNKLLNRNPSSRPQADDVLEIPVVCNMVRKMHNDEPQNERRGSVADSEPVSERRSSVPDSARRGSAVDSEAGQRPASADRRSSVPDSARRGSVVDSEAGQRPGSADRRSSVPDSARRGSAADSEAGQRPASVAYSDSAGRFCKRDKVEYLSSTHNEWLPATVMDVDNKGQILMDVKPNTWITLEVQSEKVRPRSSPAPIESKAPKRPSSAGVPQPRAAAARPMSAREYAAAKVPAARRRSSAAAYQPPSARGGPSEMAIKQSRPAIQRRSSCPEVAKYARNPNPRAPALLGA